MAESQEGFPRLWKETEGYEQTGQLKKHRYCFCEIGYKWWNKTESKPNVNQCMCQEKAGLSLCHEGVFCSKKAPLCHEGVLCCKKPALFE
jgi:hypothetical protein